MVIQRTSTEVRERERAKEGDGLSGDVREELTNKGQAQGLNCEAVRSVWLNRVNNILDYNGDEDIALTEQNNG